ncbi:MAG: GNAT family N-acetyltransferase [Acidovorax sp.]|jgi:putative acetyltransferase|nr:MAG: GNAT family N-acetyltransferase [Acidovorax sp.]
MSLRLSDLMPTVVLRSAVGRDAPELARLWREAWRSANPGVLTVAPLAHWEDRARSEFGPPCTALLVERADEALLAFMVLDIPRGHLYQLFVAPGAQSQGLGGAMVQEICQRLCSAGWTLHVATANQRARRFYARCGLEEEAVDLHPGTGRERVLCRWRPDSR